MIGSLRNLGIVRFVRFVLEAGSRKIETAFPLRVAAETRPHSGCCVALRREISRVVAWRCRALLCEVVCLGVHDGAAETLLTGVKVVPETTYLGKSKSAHMNR